MSLVTRPRHPVATLRDLYVETALPGWYLLPVGVARVLCALSYRFA